uniref:Uncharacterized protein n=1 Tax=uncultured Verrucomicrobiales bacterium HF0200_39L05 TaxID=710997 RepID=E0XUP3_9BACT|nr:hypothetical protein [uncultured Verrucomicrobiales bacterium HF0200_39L05]
MIAGSLRNSFRASVGTVLRGGRALIGLGSLTGYQNQLNSECLGSHYPGSQSASDKIRRREGNNPDHRLRCPNTAQW